MFKRAVESFFINKGGISNQNGYKVGEKTLYIRKGRCHSVWCPSCRPLAARRIGLAFARLEWKKTRRITLTYNRDRFADGESCYQESITKKHLNGFIRDLRRKLLKKNIALGRGSWAREWHEDGFQHFHLDVEVENGLMISNEVISSCWSHGMTYETYYNNEDHHKKTVGYAGKVGYFGDEKSHQGRLPAWALIRVGNIRSFGMFGDEKNEVADVPDYGSESKVNNSQVTINPRVDRFEGMTYQEKHNACGSFSRVLTLEDNGDLADWGDWDIPYNNWKNYSDGFVSGKGLNIVIQKIEFIAMHAKYGKRLVINHANNS